MPSTTTTLIAATFAALSHRVTPMTPDGLGHVPEQPAVQQDAQPQAPRPSDRNVMVAQYDDNPVLRQLEQNQQNQQQDYREQYQQSNPQAPCETAGTCDDDN